jgi:hypothetical protein
MLQLCQKHVSSQNISILSYDSPETMPGSKPLVYAELLSNIRQISVIAALDAPCDVATKVELSGDGKQFVLYHGGKTTTLSLPGSVASSVQLQKPALGSKELSWRLPLAGQPTRPDAEDAHSNEAPWSARTLEENWGFLCRDCGAVIIREGAIKTWKDLPSENWAEMMDFWHCHKPDVPEHEKVHENGSNGTSGHIHNESTRKAITTTKGYGANTKFTAIAGTAFVDITTFLLAASDCTNLEPLDKQVSSTIFCPFSFLESRQKIRVSRRRPCIASATIVWPPIQVPKINHLVPSTRFSKQSKGVSSSSVDGLPFG